MRFAHGDRLGRYTIEALIGEGGMGEVYRAEDTRLGRRVALKVLRAEGDTSQDVFRREASFMCREARAAAALSHPGVVSIFDVGEIDGTVYIAMELVEGEPLRALVGQTIPSSRKLRVLRDVALALAAAHEAGFVHRDVKPENIVVRRDGSVKVLDFGVARRLSGDFDVLRSFDTATGDSTFAGTPAYMAPEALRGEACDARADQFAWGVVAHELLSGALPFRDEKGMMSLIASILGDEPARLEGVPEDLAALLTRTLAKDPADRLASMRDIADALDVFVTADEAEVALGRSFDSPRSARTNRSRSRRTPRTNPKRARLLWLALPLALLALVGAIVFAAKEPQAAVASAVTAIEPVAPPAPPKGVAITDLPLPASDVPEARLAYREGVQALRDAAWDIALAAFAHARKADPSMAEAHLRYAMIAMDYDIPAAREAYRRAALLRSALSDRDRAVLDAFEPYIQRDPPDLPEKARRIARVAEQHPNDAELVFWQLWPTQLLKSEELLKLTERCLELDPQYADCWQNKARALRELGRADEAMKALDRCVDVSPAASDCLSERAAFEEFAGECANIEAIARRWMGKDPGSGKAEGKLATALYAQDRREPVVRAALVSAISKHRANGRDFEATRLELSLAAGFGDFEEAIRVAQEASREDALAARPHSASDLAANRARFLLELGRPDEAGRVALSFLAEHAGMIDPGAYSCAFDPTPTLLAIARRQGFVSAEEHVERREEWVRVCSSRSDEDRVGAWYGAYAAPASTAEEAREALEMMPLLAPSGHEAPLHARAYEAALRGKVLLLAGRTAEARVELVEALRTCGALWDPVSYWQTTWRLGVAEETLGDKEAACGAYQRVLSRWGGAKDSLTQKDATRRSKLLGCEGRRGS